MSQYKTSNQILNAKFGENKKNDQTDLKSDLIAKPESIIPSDTIPTPANIATLPPQNLRPAEIATPADSATQIETSPENSPAEIATLDDVLPTVKGFLHLPNSVMDELHEILDTNEQLTYIHLYRLSYGFHKDNCLVSLKQLGERTKLSERTVQKTIDSLEKKKLIIRDGNVLGGKGKRGMQIRVAKFATPADSATQNSPANSAGFKDIKDLKYKLIKEYRKLALKITEVLGERSISELCYEVELACKKAKIEFIKQIFNDNIKFIMKK
jgi:DNA-binding Lrp family transcriptional regulator